MAVKPATDSEISLIIKTLSYDLVGEADVLERCKQIKYFIENIGYFETKTAADISVKRVECGDPWRYFCGCCWKVLRGR